MPPVDSDAATAADFTLESAADAIGGILDEQGSALENVPDPRDQETGTEVVEDEQEPDKQDQPDEEVEADEKVEADPDPEKPAQDAESYTIEELAAAMEMSPDDFLASIKGKVKVDGEELEVTLNEAIRGYQREADYSKKTMELAEQRKVIEQVSEVANAHYQTVQQQAAQQGALLQNMEQQLLQGYQTEDWNSLRTNDPAEFAARQQEYQQQYQNLQVAKQNAVQQAQQAELEREAYFKQTVLPQEAVALRDAIPEWKDKEIETAERRDLARYLVDQGGYKPEEVAQLYDHRSAVIARKAMLWDRQQAKVEKSKPAVREIPKVKNLKPGKRTTKTEQTMQRRTDSLKRLRKTGSIDDAVAAMPDFD